VHATGGRAVEVVSPRSLGKFLAGTTVAVPVAHRLRVTP
jgi:hypothetical protein